MLKMISRALLASVLVCGQAWAVPAGVVAPGLPASSLNTPNGPAQLDAQGTIGNYLGATGTTAAPGNDPRIVGAVPTLLTGLVDDAATDNHIVVQAAVNATAASGVCLYVPKAVNGYALANSIVIPSHGCITGGGASALFTRQAGANLFNLFNTASGATDVHVSYIGLYGNKSNGPGTNPTEGFQIDGGSDVTIDHISATNFTGDGIAATGGATNYKITNSAASYNNLAGITTYAGSYMVDTGNITVDNGTHGNGIIGTLTHGLINGNISYNDGTVVSAADNFTGYNSLNYDIVVSNNISYGSGNHGIHFGGNKVSYIGNHVDFPANQGIFHGSKLIYTTGTLSATNGSASITGSGTSWAGICPSYNGSTQITIGATTYLIQNITGSNTLTLTTNFTGTTAAGLTYGIACYVGSTDVVMKDNTVLGVTAAGHADFWIDQVTGFTLDNESQDASAGFGAIVYGSSNGTIKGVYSQKATGVYVYAENLNSTGTVSVTNGSTTVTGTGTTWLTSIPNATVFRVNADGVNYTATVTSNTSLTLSTTYAGTTNAAATYALAEGPSNNIDIDVVANNSSGTGIQTTGCMNCRISGIASGNGSYGYSEAPPTYNTTLAGLKTDNNTIAPIQLQPGSGGIYYYQSNIVFAMNGSTKFSINGSVSSTNNSINGTAAGGPSFVNASATATVPTLAPNHTDTKAGIGASAVGAVSIIANIGGTATEGLRVNTDSSIRQFFGLVDQSVVSTVLTSSGYTVPVGTDWVWLKPTAAVTATITLPAPLGSGQPIRFDCYGFACTLSFSPAVVNWTNGTVLSAGGAMTLYYDVVTASWQHHVPQ